MGKLKAIREFFWPLLEPLTDEQIEIDQRRLSEFADSKRILKKITHFKGEKQVVELINLSRELSKAEQERNDRIERKATTFLGANGLVIALLVNFGRLLSGITDLFYFPMLIIFIITLMYLLRTIFFSLKSLERRSYHQIDIKRLLEKSFPNNLDFLKEILASDIEKREGNYNFINDKVNFMVMAQEYFKRGLISLSLLGILYIAWPFFDP